MAEGFSSNFIDKLKSNNDLVTTISRYGINLKRKGKNWWACCPFHSEKTESFAINEMEQYYHCFGCGESGDVIRFVEKIESFDFYDACKKLCEYAHMEMPEYTNDEALLQNKKKKDKMYQILQDTAIHYYNNLKLDEAKPALTYMSHRKLDRDTIKAFGLGYSLGWNELVTYLTNKGYSLADMLSAGVIEKNDNNKYYDALAKRLIFPIFNTYGNVVGFSARVLEAKPEFAKYKNTTQTLVFDKSRSIYGIKQIKDIKKSEDFKEIIIVEGQMDVISLYKSGVKNAVACMGTALTSNHARDLKRYTDKVVLCFDGDNAGIKATLRSIDILVDAGLDVFVVTIPDKNDPDEYVNKYGKESFDKLISDAKYWVEFLIGYEASIVNLTKREEKSKFVANALKIVNKLKTDSEKDIYLKMIRDISQISLDFLKKDLLNINDTKTNISTNVENVIKEDSLSKNTSENAYVKASRFVIAALLHKKPYAVLNDSIYQNLLDNDFKRIYEYIDESYKSDKKPIVSHVFDMFENAKDNNAVMSIVNYVFDDRSDTEVYYLNCVKNMVKAGLEIRKENIITKLNSTSDIADKNILKRELQIVLSELKK